MDPNLLLLLVLGVLLVWMFFSSRRRQQKMREEQERKAELMVPGARVMTRSGLFGTLVAYDKSDLSHPARVEIAPGVVVELHTQAIDLAPEQAEAAAAVDATETDERDVAAGDPLADTTVHDTNPGTAAGTHGAPAIDGVEDDRHPGDDKKA